MTTKVKHYAQVNGVFILPPDPLYVAPKYLAKELLHVMYGTCKRHDKAFCINSNFGRAVAKTLGRTIRSPNTYGGQLHWSELVKDAHGNPVWVQCVADLDPKYAAKIDEFDSNAAHFLLPRRNPFGPTQVIAVCQPRVDTAQQRQERNKRYEARVKSGKVKPRAKLRQPQYERAVERSQSL